ncbi:hypothetical protein ACGF8B_22745 [Streptomyces sp. NPDC047917]|uniref:hypothetical protein n=1 Tax=Streptomyces sp. NPDC047917 TaxID=3365491 RepID=UPI003719E3B2
MLDEGQGRATAAGAPSPDREDGRGLLIVDDLATDWGQRRVCGGLLVWTEIDTDPASLLVMTLLDSDRYREGAGPESRPWEES